MPSAARAKRGPTDPGRRERIAAAALDVALEQGVHAVSHRTVAAAAGVPLGSTTYHFASLDELLIAAVERAAARDLAELEELSERVADGADLADSLSDYVLGLLRDARDRVLAEYELYLMSLRRPALRGATSAWAAAMAGVLARHTDPATARALTIAIDGAVVQTLAAGTTPTRRALADLLRKLL